MCPAVLIIDNEPIIRQVLVFLFRSKGYCTILNAKTAKEGLTCLQGRNKWNLIILDPNLSDHDDLEILYKIREINQTVPLYIWMSSYKKYSSQLQKALRKGISFRILRKPYDSYRLGLIAQSHITNKYRNGFY